MAEPVATCSVSINAENGLHIRPAEMLARLANKFTSRIELVHEQQRVDAKSIMDMLTLGVSQGATLSVEAEGPDAQQAIEAITLLVANDFHMPGDSTTTL